MPRYPFLLIALLSCKVPSPPTIHTPPSSIFSAWLAAESAGWEMTRHALYCLRLPIETSPVCVIGVNTDRCAYPIQDDKHFSITVMPPKLADDAPDHFLRSDGSTIPKTEVTPLSFAGERAFSVQTREHSGRAREIHIAPLSHPFWFLVQYEGLSEEEATLADRAISTFLLPGRGPLEDGKPACPFPGKR